MKTNRQLRIEFVTEKKAVRLWSATNIVLCNTKDEHLHSYINKIGPDVLDDATNQTVIRKRLIEKKSPFEADNNHIHHILLSYLKDHYKVVVSLLLSTLMVIVFLQLLFN